MKTILILDDEPIVRESLSDFFEDRYWRPVQAESAEEALEMLDFESPVAAVVDIRLGGMDGDAFIRAASQRKISMVFVVCTGSPEYTIPADLLALPCVSKQLFRKPLIAMLDLEENLLQLITRMKENEVKDE